MPRIRTFIAIDCGPAIRARIDGVQEDLARVCPEVKWVEKENLHLTLLFLGEVDNREIPDVCKAVANGLKDLPPFELSVEGTGCFPNLRRPRTLWIGVRKGSAEVKAVHAALEKQLLALGCYRREERAFTPHITVGRVKSDGPMDKLAEALIKHQDWQAGETTVSEVLVMSSQLTSKGPTYAIMSRGKMSAAG